MSNASPGDIFNGGGDPFMSKEQKHKFCAERTPLGIVGARPKYVSQYGQRTAFTVVSQGERFVLDITHNEIRERQATAILELLSSGATSVGPVYLIQVPTKNGNKAWALDKEPMPVDVAVVSTDQMGDQEPGSSVPDPGFSGDDDIPF